MLTTRRRFLSACAALVAAPSLALAARRPAQDDRRRLTELALRSLAPPPAFPSVPVERHGDHFLEWEAPLPPVHPNSRCALPRED